MEAFPRGRALYRHIPEEVRRCLRPLNLIDECASFLPGSWRGGLAVATDVARRLLRVPLVRYPMRRLDGVGRADGNRLVCLLATDDLSARYWSRLFFAAPPAETVLGEVHGLGIAAAARRLTDGADFSLWQTPWPLGTAASDALRIPSWVPLSLATDRPLEAVITGERRGRAARKNDVRRVERLGVTRRLTSDARAVERFRQELYEPYARSRFGDLFVPLPAHVFRHARRHGWLLVVEHEAQPVAGALLERAGRELSVVAFGVAADARVPAGAALEACYYHAIRIAVEWRVPRLRLGACRPVLSDGVLRYKRKWGAQIGAPTTRDAFLLRHRNTPATRAAFSAAPLVVDRGRGRLAALVGAAGGDLAAQLRQIDTPGLGELVCLVGDAERESPASAGGSRLRLVTPDDAWPASTGRVAGWKRPRSPWRIARPSPHRSHP